MSKLEAVTIIENPLPRVVVQTTVVFSILNGFTRRSNRDFRVIGTLLGEEKDGNITISDCFIVPHKERANELSVDINREYHKSMTKFHKRNNKKEQIVGWFATTALSGEFINDNTSLIHDFYSEECENPIHIVVDTTLAGSTMSVRGFIGKPMKIRDVLLANTFNEVAVKIELTDTEASCIYPMIEGQKEKWSSSVITSGLESEHNTLLSGVQKLITVIENISQYVDDVVDGKVPPSRDTGIAIADALHILTHRVNNSLKSKDMNQHNSKSTMLDDEDSKPILQDKIEDLLLVSYLSTLTQAQTLISEKLNAIL